MITYKQLKQKISAYPFFSSPFYLKHRQFIIPGVVLGIALLICVLVTVPQFLKLFETFKNIEELGQKKSFLQEKKAMLTGLDLELYRKNLDTALIALPVEKDIPGVTGELLLALSGSGMTLGGIDFAGGGSETSEVQEYVLRFDVSGQESGLNNFLDRVKQSPRIVKLTALDVSKGKSNDVNASLTFVTIFQPLPEDIGTVENEVPELTPEDNKVLADIQEKIQAIPQVTTTKPGSQPVSGKLNPFVN